MMRFSAPRAVPGHDSCALVAPLPRCAAPLPRFSTLQLSTLWLALSLLALCAASPAGAQTKPRVQVPAAERSQARALVRQLLREGKIMRARDARRGMKGVARSVFQGTRIEEFPIEVIGVLEKVMGGGDLVLIRVTGGPVVKRQSGIIQGMSGSPVYINGKMLGAIAIGFGFPKEPIGGVTPITDMIETSLPDPARRKVVAPSGATKPAPAKQAGGKSEAGAANPQTDARRSNRQSSFVNRQWLYRPRAPLWVAGRRVQRVVVSRDRRLAAFSGDVRAATMTMRPASLLLQVSGVSPASLPRLRRVFEPYGIEPVIGGGLMRGAQVVGPSSKKSGVQPPFTPGGAIGVQLVSGDMDMTAVGTITFRRGNRVLAFGHPMFGIGNVSMPMATAYVHEIFPAYDISFKLASPVRAVGALQQDTNFAVGGTVGMMADTIPMRVSLRNPARQIAKTFRVQMMKDPLFTPQLALNVAVETLSTTLGLDSDKMLRVGFKMQVEGAPPIVRRNYLYAPDELASTALSELMDSLMLTQLNAFGRSAIKSIALDVVVEPVRKTARIKKIFADRNKVKAGESFQVVVEMEPQTTPGKTFTRSFRFEVPDDAPSGAVRVVAGPATEYWALQGRVGEAPPRPTNLRELLAAYARVGAANELLVQASTPRTFLLIDRNKVANPPPSWLKLLRTASSSAISAYNEVQTRREASDYALSGTQFLSIAVESTRRSDRTAPDTAARESAPSAPSGGEAPASAAAETSAPPPPPGSDAAFDPDSIEMSEMSGANSNQRNEDQAADVAAALRGDRDALRRLRAGIGGREDIAGNRAGNAETSGRPARMAPTTAPLRQQAAAWRAAMLRAQAAQQRERQELQRQELQRQELQRQNAAPQPPGDGATPPAPAPPAPAPQPRDPSGNPSPGVPAPGAPPSSPPGAAPAPGAPPSTVPAPPSLTPTTPEGAVADTGRNLARPALRWIQSTPEDFARGEFAGTQVTSGGTIQLAAPAALLATTTEPFAWSIAADARGNTFLGTGNEARIIRIDSGGKQSTIYNGPEVAVTALATDAAGNLYAGVSPGGRVLRFAPGQAAGARPTTIFDSGQTFVWALEFDEQGRLLVATGGGGGALFRLDSPSTRAASADGVRLSSAVTPLARVPQRHIRAISVRGGDIFAGTGDDAVLYQIDGASGAARALYQIAPPAAPGQSGAGMQADMGGGGGPPMMLFGGGSSSVFTLLASAGADAGSRGLGGVRAGGSEILAVAATPDGVYFGTSASGAVLRWNADGVSTVYTAPQPAIYALRRAPDGSLLAAAGERGAVYRIRPATGGASGGSTSASATSAARLLEPSQSLALALAVSPGGDLVVGTGNNAAAYRVPLNAASGGIFTSNVFDAKNVVQWGALRVIGSGAIAETRSGNTLEPDEGWSAWQPAAANDLGELRVASPSARYLQYRVRLSDGSPSAAAQLSRVEVVFRAKNSAPAVLLASPRGGEYWRAKQKLTWSGQDPDNDTLRYRLFLSDDDGRTWKPVEPGNIAEPSFELDTTKWRDGVYRARIEASDALRNPDDPQRAERISAPFTIDNTAPRITAQSLIAALSGASPGGAAGGAVSDTASGANNAANDPNLLLRATASDDLSPIAGAEWRIAPPEVKAPARGAGAAGQSAASGASRAAATRPGAPGTAATATAAGTPAGAAKSTTPGARPPAPAIKAPTAPQPATSNAAPTAGAITLVEIKPGGSGAAGAGGAGDAKKESETDWRAASAADSIFDSRREEIVATVEPESAGAANTAAGDTAAKPVIAKPVAGKPVAGKPVAAPAKDKKVELRARDAAGNTTTVTLPLPRRP